MVLLLLCVTKLFIFHATQWPVNKSPPSTSQSSLTLGLMLDSDHAQSILDTGPQADSVEVSGFCLFVCLLNNVASLGNNITRYGSS